MVRKNQRQLGMNSDIGQSIVRRFSVHDESIFTLEQRISIILKKKHGTWVAVVWLDTGKELKDRPLAPLSLDLPNSRWLCRPVIQYQSKIAFRSHDTSCNSSVPPSDSAQSANLLASQYGSLLDHNSMRNDPMYALSELFEFSAASECQFLNMMQHQIEKEFFVIEAQTDWSLENLRYHKTLLDDHIQSMKGTLHALRRPLIPGSPAEERISEAVQNVLEDFTHLLEQAQTLAAKCIEGINTIVSTTQLKESREGIKQAEGLRRLTLLAFFFLPLSFTTSFFGMNFRELGTGTLSLWVVFVVLVPVVAVSSALCFWDELKDYLRFGYGTG